MVFVELTIAAMQGFAQALAERFIRGRENSVALRSVVGEVEAIKKLQASDRDGLNELKRLLEQVLDRADGLEVRRRKVVFRPTEQTPDVEMALLNLDLEISKACAPQQEPPGPATAAELASRAQDPSSIFYQLDEEIAFLRRGKEDPR